jgi:hypothetical protein
VKNFIKNLNSGLMGQMSRPRPGPAPRTSVVGNTRNIDLPQSVPATVESFDPYDGPYTRGEAILNQRGGCSLFTAGAKAFEISRGGMDRGLATVMDAIRGNPGDGYIAPAGAALSSGSATATLTTAVDSQRYFQMLRVTLNIDRDVNAFDTNLVVTAVDAQGNSQARTLRVSWGPGSTHLLLLARTLTTEGWFIPQNYSLSAASSTAVDEITAVLTSGPSAGTITLEGINIEHPQFDKLAAHVQKLF